MRASNWPRLADTDALPTVHAGFGPGETQVKPRATYTQDDRLNAAAPRALPGPRRNAQASANMVSVAGSIPSVMLAALRRSGDRPGVARAAPRPGAVRGRRN